MSSPEVWADAKARITAVATTLALPVAWPNEPFDPPDPLGMHLVTEISGDMAAPIEIGGTGASWEETGTVWLHLMVPAGDGIDGALAARKTLANAFRGVTINGIAYTRATMDPSGPADDDGNWTRVTLRVHYSYQDR